jgi:serine/threonine-protein kinase PknK
VGAGIELVRFERTGLDSAMPDWLVGRRHPGSDREGANAMALRHKSPLEVSDLLPGYTDITEIGDGEMATVYSAKESESGRSVALKLLNVREISPADLETLLRETSVLETLSVHPNIVTLYRTEVTPDGRPVLVMDLCQGPVAHGVAPEGGMEPAHAVSTVIKIAGALETAHRAGIVHGSVTPRKLLMHHGEPALADLGVARLRSSSDTAGVIGFDTLYAAPEMLEGTPATTATDIYELASTLYLLLAGHAAFRSFDGEAPAAVIVRILRDPIQPLLAQGVPMALSDLLVQAMAKNPLKRPSSALELADRLKAIEDAQSWPPTSYFVVGESAYRFLAPMPSSEVDEIGSLEPGDDAWSFAGAAQPEAAGRNGVTGLVPLPAGSPGERTPRSNGTSGSQVPAASLLWFASTARDRIASHEPPRFDAGWVPPDRHPAWSPRPIARHAPAPVVAPTTRVERHVIAPTPIREIASRRIVASRPTPTTSPNTGRRFAAPDPLLRLLSSASPHQDPATPVIHPRFLDPRPRNVPDRARETRPDGEGTAHTPAPGGVDPTPAPDSFGYPSPDLVEQAILRPGPPGGLPGRSGASPEPSPDEPDETGRGRHAKPPRHQRDDGEAPT